MIEISNCLSRPPHRKSALKCHRRRRHLEGHSLQATQTGLELKVDPFATPKLLYWTDQMLAVMLLSSMGFCHSKPSDLVLHVVPDV